MKYLIFLLCLSTSLFAQDRFKGIILSTETGQPISSVIVEDVNTQKWVLSDIDGSFEIDTNSTKNLKLASNVWADNGYRFRTLNQVLNDYFRETPFILDAVDGQYRTVDFDFGLLYAVNNSLRIGIHFKDPYFEIFWRILEF